MVLGACGAKTGGETKDTYDIAMAATEKVNDADAMSFDMNIDMKMTISGSEQEIHMEGPVKVLNNGDDDIQFYAKQETSMLGINMALTMYYRDGYLYTEVEDQKVKQAVDAAEMSSQQSTSLTIFDKSFIKSSSDKKVAAGTEYRFTIDGAGLKDMVIKSMGSSAGLEGVSEDDMTFGDAEVVMVLDKDGNVVSQSMEMAYEMVILEQTVMMNMVMNVKNIKTGGVTIDFPADLDTYQESAV
jgi:hypothetical protein